MVAGFRSVAGFMGDVVSVASSEFGSVKNMENSIKLISSMGSMAKGVAEALKVVGTDLVPLTEETGMLWWKDAAVTTKLEEAVPELKSSFRSVAKFLGSCVDALREEFPAPRDAEVATNLLSNLGPMVENISDAMRTTTFEMVPLGVWSGLDYLEEGIPELRRSFRIIARFLGGIVETLREQFPAPRDVVVASVLLENLAVMVESVVTALEATANNLIPLTKKKGWLPFFRSSMLEDLQGAIPALETGFNAVAEFLGSVVRTLQTQFPAPRDVIVAAVLMENLGQLTKSTASALWVMSFTLLPLVKKKGWIPFFRSSMLEDLQGAIPALEAGFNAIAEFLGSVVRTLKEQFPAPRDVQVAAFLMTNLGMMTVAMSTSLTVMSATLLPLVKKRGWIPFFRSSALEDLQGAIPALDKGFTAIAEFLGSVVRTLQEQFPAPRDVLVAAQLMRNLAFMASDVSLALQVMSVTLLPLVEKKGWIPFFRSSKLGDLEGAVPDLQRGLNAVFKFLGGFIDTLRESFPAPRDVQVAAFLMTNIAIMAVAVSTALSAIANNLMPLIQKKGWIPFFRSSKLEDLEGAIPDLKNGLEIVFRFLGGFIDTLKEEFPNPRDVQVAGVLLSALAEMAKGIATTLDVVATELIPLTQGWFLGWFGSSPLEDLESAIPELTRGFGIVMTFFNNLIGIMKEQYADFGDVITAGIFLEYMGKMATGIGKTLDVVATELLPLTQGWFLGWFGSSPLDDLEAAIPELQAGIGQVMNFLRYGVIEPLRGFVQPSEIEPMVKSMVATVMVVKTLPIFLEELTKAIEPLVGGVFWSPIAGIEAKVTEFAENFGKIAWFIHDAVIMPLFLLPPPEEIMAIINKLAAVSGVFAMIPVMLSAFTENLGELSSGWFWSPISGIEAQVEEFADSFFNIAKFMDLGIILPLQLLPPAEDINAAIGKVKNMSLVFEAIPGMLSSFTENLGDLTSGWFWSPLDSIESQAEEFAENFGNIMRFFEWGMIYPLMLLPPAETIGEMKGKLTALTGVIQSVAPMLATFTEQLGPLVSGWFWSPLDSIESQTEEFADQLR